MLNKTILFLAENPTPEIDPDRVRPGLAGLVSFFLLAIAVAVISYFMNRSLKRTNQRFKDEN